MLITSRAVVYLVSFLQGVRVEGVRGGLRTGHWRSGSQKGNVTHTHMWNVEGSTRMQRQQHQQQKQQQHALTPNSPGAVHVHVAERSGSAVRSERARPRASVQRGNKEDRC